MPRPPTKQTKKSLYLGQLFLVVLFLLPIAVYGWIFGYSISSNHTRWSEMGSAMAGIYTPALAILTLLVLIAQVRVQDQMNEHTFDQSFIQDARVDLHFYLEQLANELTKEFDDGSVLQTMLVQVFAYPTLEELKSERAIEIATALNKRNHRLVAVWSAIYGILVGLKANDYHPYSTYFITGKQKAIAMLSYEGCVALDNFMWCATKGRLAYPYEFSPVPASSVRKLDPAF